MTIARRSLLALRQHSIITLAVMTAVLATIAWCLAATEGTYSQFSDSSSVHVTIDVPAASEVPDSAASPGLSGGSGRSQTTAPSDTPSPPASSPAAVDPSPTQGLPSPEDSP